MMARRSARETCAIDESSPQQILELRLAPGAGTAEAFDDAAAHRLPEAGGVEQFDEEEVAAGGLEAFTDLPEQVCLARTRLLSLHDDAQRGRHGVTGGVAEGVHHVVDGILVESLDVRRRLRSPQVVRGGGPRQPKRCERFPVRFLHQGSIAIRCLSWSPITMAASRSAAVSTF